MRYTLRLTNGVILKGNSESVELKGENLTIDNDHIIPVGTVESFIIETSRAHDWRQV